jgi:hypothetical protein
MAAGVPGCRTLFATHYLQLAAIEKLPGVANVQVLVKQHNDQLVFLHQVAPGAADKSWGVHVARLAGVPNAVVERARDLLLGFESHGAAGHDRHAKPRRRPNPPTSYRSSSDAAGRRRQLGEASGRGSFHQNLWNQAVYAPCLTRTGIHLVAGRAGGDELPVLRPCETARMRRRAPPSL